MVVWSGSISVNGEEVFKVSGLCKIRPRVSSVDVTKWRRLCTAEMRSFNFWGEGVTVSGTVGAAFIL